MGKPTISTDLWKSKLRWSVLGSWEGWYLYILAVPFTLHFFLVLVICYLITYSFVLTSVLLKTIMSVHNILWMTLIWKSEIIPLICFWTHGPFCHMCDEFPILIASSKVSQMRPWNKIDLTERDYSECFLHLRTKYKRNVNFTKRRLWLSLK